MKKIVGYRYQCPKCGYTYKLYNGGARPAADYLCPIHKIVMPAAAIEQSEDITAPVVREDTQRKDELLELLACYGCDFYEDCCDDFDGMAPQCAWMMSRAKELLRGYCDENTYTIDQIVDALLQDDDDIITAIRQQYKEALRTTLMNYIK